MASLTIFSNYQGDWEGIYVNRQLEYENHSVEMWRISDIAEEIDEPIVSISHESLNMKACGITSLPEDLEKLENLIDKKQKVEEKLEEYVDELRCILSGRSRMKGDEIQNELDLTKTETEILISMVRHVPGPRDAYRNDGAVIEVDEYDGDTSLDNYYQLYQS